MFKKFLSGGVTAALNQAANVITGAEKDGQTLRRKLKDVEAFANFVQEESATAALQTIDTIAKNRTIIGLGGAIISIRKKLSENPKECVDEFMADPAFFLFIQLARLPHAPELRKECLLAIATAMQAAGPQLLTMSPRTAKEEFAGKNHAMLLNSLVESMIADGFDEQWEMSLLALIKEATVCFIENPAILALVNYSSNSTLGFPMLKACELMMERTDDVGKRARQNIARLCQIWEDPWLQSLMKEHIKSSAIMWLVSSFWDTLHNGESTAKELEKSAQMSVRKVPLDGSQLIIAVDYLNTVASKCSLPLLRSMLTDLEEMFLKDAVRKNVVKVSEATAALTIRLALLCLAAAKSPALRAAFARGIVGADTTGDIEGTKEYRSRLVMHAQSMNHDLSVCTLQLLLSVMDTQQMDAMSALFAPSSDIGYGSKKVTFKEAADAVGEVLDTLSIKRNLAADRGYAASSSKTLRATAELFACSGMTGPGAKPPSLAGMEHSECAQMLLSSLRRTLQQPADGSILVTGMVNKLILTPDDDVLPLIYSPDCEDSSVVGVCKSLAQVIVDKDKDGNRHAWVNEFVRKEGSVQTGNMSSDEIFRHGTEVLCEFLLEIHSSLAARDMETK